MTVITMDKWMIVSVESRNGGVGKTTAARETWETVEAIPASLPRKALAGEL